MIRIEKVQNNQKELLFNVFQHMLYEMTQFYDNEFDDKGLIHYGYFDEYFIDPKRSAYFIYHDNTLIGFFMLHPYPYFEQSIDYNLAEFTIFPAFRRKGYGTLAVQLMFQKFKGIWEIKFNTKNVKAHNFWMKVTKNYQPEVLTYDVYEKVLRFKVGEKNE